MPVLDVKNLDGKKVGTVELADDVFGVEVNEHLLHEAVRHRLAGERAGTHKTKDKSEVSGSGKKLWKQKGTGRARVGSIRSPLWRHGGTVHGPTPRNYDYALPKKMILGALRSALSIKAAEQKLTVVEAWALETHKTKVLRQTLGKLNGETRTILLVENAPNVNLERASRNMHGVTLVPDIRSRYLRPDASRPPDAFEGSGVEAEPRLSRQRRLNAGSGADQKQRREAAPAEKAPVKASAKPKAAAKPAAKKPRPRPKSRQRRKSLRPSPRRRRNSLWRPGSIK